VSTTTMRVLMPSHILRRPLWSVRCPATGASAAMAKPETDMAKAKVLVALSAPPNPSFLVKYKAVKMKVVMTALNAAPPQSHNDQAVICQVVPGFFSVLAVGTAAAPEFVIRHMLAGRRAVWTSPRKH